MCFASCSHLALRKNRQRTDIISTSHKLKNLIAHKISELENLASQKNSVNSEKKSYEAEQETQRIISTSLYEMTRLLQKLDYSALRDMKEEFLPALGSQLISLIVESMGETLKLTNLKLLDFNYNFLYQKHLKNLKLLAENKNSSSASYFWHSLKQRMNLKKNADACFLLTGRCIDQDFVDKVSKVDLIDKKFESENFVKSYVPINQEMEKLIDKRASLHALSCKKILGAANE